MKHVYKLIFIALLFLGLCVGGVWAITWLNPTMTSNTDPYGVDSASSDLGSGFEPWNSFDHVTNEYGWTVASGTTVGMYYFTNVPKMSTWNAVVSKTGYANASTTFEMGYY